MMKKYKSLIFRELRLSRKHYITGTLLTVLLAAFMVLAMFVSGGEAINNGESLDVFALFMSYAIAAVATGCFTSDNGISKADMNSGWQRYSYVLPVTAFEKAAARYAVKLIAITIGMAVAIIGAAVVSAVGGSTLKFGTVLSFWILLDAFLIYDVFYQTIILRAKDKKSLKKMGYIASGIAFFVFFILPEFIPEGKMSADIDAFMKDMETMESPAGMNKYIDSFVIPEIWGIIGIILMFVLLAVGFIVTWKNYERREA